MGGFLRTGSGRVGDIRISSGPELDRDLLLCDGAVYDAAQFPRLFGRIGAKYNRPGDSFGGTKFRVPDIQFARQATKTKIGGIETNPAGNVVMLPGWSAGISGRFEEFVRNTDVETYRYIAIQPQHMDSPPPAPLKIWVLVNSIDNSGSGRSHTIIEAKTINNRWDYSPIGRSLDPAVFAVSTLYDSIDSTPVDWPVTPTTQPPQPLIVAINNATGAVYVVRFTTADMTAAHLVLADTNDLTNGARYFFGVVTYDQIGWGGTLPIRVLPDSEIPASALALLSGYKNIGGSKYRLNVGESGGAESVTLTTGNLPQHDHGVKARGVDTLYGTTSADDRRPQDWSDGTASETYRTGPAGLLVPDPVQILPPYQSVIYGIKYR